MNKTVFEEGIEKGIEKGRLLGRQELAILLLERRFGAVSASLRRHIESLSMPELSALMLQADKANSLREAGLADFKD